MHALRRTATALAAAGALSLSGLPATFAATAAPRTTDGRPVASAQAVAVTLVTGDRVLVSRGPGGRPMAAVVPASIPGRHVAFTTMTDSKGDVRVIPSDMLPLVGTVLDAQLFDVSELIRQGYDDAHSGSLPLIVQHAEGTRGAAGALATASLRSGRELTSIHSTAAREPRGTAAGGLGKDLAAAGRAALTRHRTIGALGAEAGPLSGITHIWLDGKVKATDLDWNLTKVSAPTAWAAGHTGKGVTVAVIDTGVDSTHPDLRDRVVDSANFSDSADAIDHYGHGTHVAGTIAGSGVASDGARKGIAYDARLLNVKVLNDQGNGSASGVIAGMEWAAQRGAKVANMSLGGGPTDGTDPESQALNELTAQYGTLFVVAAGNSGGNPVGSPGAADAALTVSASDSSDQIAEFSSVGPRAGDYALKPDISAPGVGIVQDRAAGTSLGGVVDQYYTTLSGTSMATPHVTAAAALVAAERPDLTARQIKALLQESSDVATRNGSPLPVFHMGAGRLNAAGAFAQQVVPDRAAFDFGLVDCTVTSPQSRTVKLSNTGSTDVTFGLDLRGGVFHSEISTPGALPDGAVKLAASTVTVPAGGTADVTVVIDPQAMPASGGPGRGDGGGDYSGQVNATPVAGGQPFHLAFGFRAAPDQCRVAVSGLDRDGNPAAGAGSVAELDENTGGLFTFGPAGGTLLLRRGDHFSITGITERLLSNGHLETATLASAEQVAGPDSKIVIDARRAHPALVKVPAATSPDLVALNTVRTAPGGHFVQIAEVAGWVNGDARYFDMYAGMLDDSTATLGTLTTTQYHHLVDAAHAEDPADATSAYELAWNSPAFPPSLTRVLSEADARRLATVHADYHQPGWADDANHDCVSRLPSDGVHPLFYTCDPVAMPSRRTEYVTPGIGWQRQTWHMGSNGYLVQALAEAPHTYTAGKQVHESLWGGPLKSTASGTQTADAIRINAQDLVDSTGTTQLWNTPVYHRGALVSVALWRDGQLINHFDSGIGMAYDQIPDKPTTWKFERGIELSGDLAQGIESTTDWEVRTSPVAAGSTAVLPLLDVGYGAHLDGWNHARPGVDLPITVQVHRAKGAAPSPVIAVQAWYSLDGGMHWIKLDDRRVGDAAHRVVLKAEVLKPGQPVSLRVTARDAGGSTVDQKLIDAFHVAG